MSLDELVATYRDYYGTYHHHKEQMAYAATVLYLAGATTVAFTGPQIWQYPVPAWLISGVLLATAVVAFFFVWWQFRQREFAADMVAACTTLAAWSVASTLANPDLSTKSYKCHDFPAVLVQRLEDTARKRGRTGGPRRSEGITYLIMGAWSFSALVAVWPLRFM